MKVRDIIHVAEATYPGNLGATEMFKFQRVASPKQKAQMKKIVDSGNWSAYKKLIHAVLGVSLH